MVEVTSQLFRYYSRYYCQIVCQWALACVAFYTNDSNSWLIGKPWVSSSQGFPYRMVGYLSSVCVQFCFQGHIFHEGVDLIDTHSLFFVPDFGFRVFNKGEIKRTISSHLFRSVGNQRFEEGDWTTATTSGKHFWPGLSWVSFKCYLLCTLIVLVQVKIFDKHFMVLLETAKAKMKGEQISQGIKERFWIVVSQYLVLQ